MLTKNRMDNVIYFIKSILTNELAYSGFPLIYKGEMDHSIMRSFALMANRKIQEKQLPTSIRKRVFHIIIECLQNVTKHSDDFDEKEKQIGNGLFVVGETMEGFYVITGNIVMNDKIKMLRERIDTLNGASAEELRGLFIKQMMEGEIDAKGGAGLGLIDIARKSGKKLYYHFVPFNERSHYFILVVTIPSSHNVV
jgi:hypothetical protein